MIGCTAICGGMLWVGRTTDATDMRHNDVRKSKSRDVVRARRMS